MKEKQIAHLIKKHPLSDVWNFHPEALSNNYEEIVEPPPIEKIIGEMFAIGQFYYYVLNLANSTLSNHDPTITTHRKNILAKTNCNKVSELVKKAFEWALI